MRAIFGLGRSVIALSIWMLSTLAFADQQPGDEFRYCETFTIQIENDAVGETDRNYTGGIRLACAGSMPEFAKRRLRSMVPEDMNARYKASYGLGQNIYTPDDLSEPELIEDDQPYAGWLYLDFGFETEVASARDEILYLDQLGLQLGVVGSLSGAEQVQRFFHEVLDVSEPEGWDNQLDNEPGVNLFYSRQWIGFKRYRLPLGDHAPGLFVDLTPKVGAALGNIYINAATGLTLRFGHFQPNDHGPQTIRPSFTGSDSLPRGDSWSAYLFGGVEGRAVGRNIFLDGNSFDSDSPSVDKNRLVGEGRLGLALTYGDMRFTYTHVYRSQEFEGQDPQIYGGLTLSIGF